LEPASLLTKPRRSKWVKAFIDLIHPAGPWGGFSNTPAIDSSARHSFKSYRVRKIHEQLQKYNGLDRGHLQLKDALHEFYEREQYQKDFLAACETYCLQEVKKPIDEREWLSGTAVAFNSPATTAPVVAAAPAMLVARATERSGVQSIEEQEVDCPVTVPATPAAPPTDSAASAAERSNKRPAEEESLDTERPTCRRRYHGDDSDGSGQNENNQYDDAEEVDSSLQTSTPPSPSNGSGINERQCAPSLVSPSSPSSTPVEMTTTATSVTPPKQDKDDRKLQIQDKRAELVSFVTLRRQTLSESPAGDALCQKIQGKIDQLDEELFELIAC
jgi:hypothetical protein